MTKVSPTAVSSALPKRNLILKSALYGKKIVHGSAVIGQAFYVVLRKGLYKNTNNPANTRYIQAFCRKFCRVFNLELHVHGEIPIIPALWVSNHISWLDIMVLGASARVFFLSKAEVKDWPILGRLASLAGTLYIKRGSGDSLRIRQQIRDFLQQDIPVLFFPEGTTGDGKQVAKVHGRLLQAAIDAQRPVQVCVICYVNQLGELDQVIPFIDQQRFLDNVTRVLQTEAVTAHLMALPAIDTLGKNLTTLTDEVQQAMRQGLLALQQQVLRPNAQA